MHYKNFARTWNEYLAERPHTFEMAVDSHGNGTLRLQRTVPLPQDLALCLGEYLYQLRAALDNCLYAAAVLDTGADPPPNAELLQWPICETPGQWRRARRRLTGLSEPLVAYLESMQPYHVEPELLPWNCLRMVNDLARVDRHRTLHAVGLRVAHVKLRYDKRYVSDVEVAKGALAHNDVLVGFTFRGPGELRRDHIDGDFQFEIDLADVVEAPDPSHGDPRLPYGAMDKRLLALWEVLGGYMEHLIELAHPDAAVPRQCAPSS